MQQGKDLARHEPLRYAGGTTHQMGQPAQSLTLVPSLKLKLGAVAAVAGGAPCTDVEDVDRRRLESGDDDAGHLAAGRGVAELLVLLKNIPEQTCDHEASPSDNTSTQAVHEAVWLSQRLKVGGLGVGVGGYNRMQCYAN